MCYFSRVFVRLALCLNAVTNAMMLVGGSEDLEDLYESQGYEAVLAHVNNDLFRPSLESLLSSAKMRRPEIFIKQLDLLLESDINLMLPHLLLCLVNRSNRPGLEAVLKKIPIAAQDAFLDTIMEHAVETSRLRVALWARTKMFERGDGTVRYRVDEPENYVLEYVEAFVNFEYLRLCNWLCLRSIEDEARIQHELLVLSVEHGLETSLFRYLITCHAPQPITQDLRLELLVALIMYDGPINELDLIIGRVNDPTRLWLAYVDEEEIGRRLIDHGRLDLVYALIRSEFSGDEVGKNEERMRRALQAAADAWPVTRFNCKIGTWLAQFQVIDETKCCVRLLPYLGALNQDDPVGRAAFRVAFQLIVIKRGALFQHLSLAFEEK